MLAKVKSAPACREANNNKDTINIKDNSTSSREASNIQHELATTVKYGNSRVDSIRANRNITDVNSRRETRNSKDANSSTTISRGLNRSSMVANKS
jgi:hypothetical protein